jgi:hypothetical protein
VPERSDEFAHLSLDRLRAYRTALSEEENRVSYWRRIMQARLDVVLAGGTINPGDVESLRGVLATSRHGGGRTALVTIVPDDKLPPLPDLTGLWERDPVPGNDKHNDRLSRDLGQAERELSAYRTALHRRIAAATTELIARYREHPALCLSALPDLPEPRRHAVG